MFQVPALKRDLEQARINQTGEIGRLCYERLFRWYGKGYLATVPRTNSAMQRQAFVRIGGKGPAGPTRAAVLRSRRTASVRRRWTGHSALTKRRSSPSSQRGGQARPFPTSARRPVVAEQKVRGISPKACGGKADGPRQQGTRHVVARQKVRGNKACDGNAQGPRYQPEGLTGGQPTQNPLSSAVSGKLWQIFYSDRSCLRSFVFSGVIMNAVSLNGARR